VRILGAGDAVLDRILPAIAHLRSEWEGEPELTICAWDSASTGVEFPALSWFDPARPPQLETLYRGEETEAGFYSFVSRVLSLLDRRAGRAVYWTADARDLPGFESACPLRTVLHWWHGERGRVFAHAGCVGCDGDGVLITGMSGRGKSTTALTCLLSGMSYASDDYVLLDQTGAGVVAHSLYAVGKLVPSQVERFPILGRLGEGVFSGPLLDKTMIMLGERFAERMATSLRVRAIVVPQVTGRVDSRCLPAAQSRALLAMMPSTMFQLPGSGEREFALLSRAVKRLPCYILEAGTDLEQIPQVIQDVIEKAVGHA
jgi:hypothetical protein